MKKEKKQIEWAIPGGLLLGLGIGCFLLPTYGGLAFTGSLLGGLGIGMLIVAFYPKK